MAASGEGSEAPVSLLTERDLWSCARSYKHLAPLERKRIHLLQFLAERDLKMAYTSTDPNRPKLRLLMGRSLDPNVKPDTPRRDAYIPVMGFVGKSEYVISKISSGATSAGDSTQGNTLQDRSTLEGRLCSIGFTASLHHGWKTGATNNRKGLAFVRNSPRNTQR